MTDLFTPITLGELSLPNRIIMAPLTRCRAIGRVPNALMATYYVQRASAGLIISEATSVTPMGVGYPDTPGIWSAQQVAGWRTVTQAVHQAGGRMLLQLWHVGRVSDPLYLEGELPVAPSAIAPSGHVSLVRPEKSFVTPRALAIEEIPDIIAAYKTAAQNAKTAGFDGVEIHGANGYLLDQFLQSSTNQRRDAYGGSLENRARLLLAVVDAAIDVWGAGRVGVHLSPRADAHGMFDANPQETFIYVAKALAARKIAFICLREYQANDSLLGQIKQAFGGAVIANEKFDFASAQTLVEQGQADAVAFGKLFIANPDLPARFATAAPLNTWDAATFYGSGEIGYTDYPSIAAVQ